MSSSEESNASNYSLMSNRTFDAARIELPLEELTVRLWSVELFSSGDSEWLQQQQLNSTYALVVLLNGEGELVRNARTCRMAADTAYWCMPETTFRIVPAAGGQLSAAVIRFGLYRPLDDALDTYDPDAIRSSNSTMAVSQLALVPVTTDRLPFTCCEDVFIEPAGQLAERCRSIYRSSRHEDGLLRWRAQSELYELLYEMLSAVRSRTRGSSLHALERVKEWMAEHYREDLSIERLAGIAELSPNYFADLFKKTYGISALDMLLEIRMAKAKQLMLRSDRKLRDIAHEVGYEDEFYFSRKFKKVYQLSPSHYLKQRIRRIAAYGCTASIGYLTPLHVVPHAAPLHPKWSGNYYQQMCADIPYHLDAYRNTSVSDENYVLLAEAKPELIVCTPNVNASEKQRLDHIASTLVLPEEGPFSWKAGLREVAAALGEQAEAERWIANYERRTSMLNKQVAEALNGESVLVVRMFGEGLFSYTNQGIEDVLYNEMGVARPRAFPTAASLGERLTPEQLDEVGADHILLLICQESETLSYWHRLRQSAEWKLLESVREGRLKLIPSNPWREYSPAGVERLREEIVTIFR
ncbi:AraC family transcriptional regulator (plasmid) [Paenibacillus cellulosilyticus]|nr:AraC family transcriptional regulator [Paenibacillus cellulosilyticus]